MTIVKFPNVDRADHNGVLGLGGDLEIESLLLAYRSGIFPWPMDDMLVWFAPPLRALLFFNKLHVSKSLVKDLKRKPYQFKIDSDFESVISACAELTNRTRQKSTWITADMVRAYTALHRAGFAHSVECYLEDKLVGGLYGVSIGQMFAGESMFYRVPNASKLCLCYLIEYIKSRGASWLDCQVMTPHLKHFGAVEVARKDYMRYLNKAIMSKTPLFP